MRSKILRRVSWQTDQLYRIEGARRALQAARQEAREIAAIRAWEAEGRRKAAESWRLEQERRLAKRKWREELERYRLADERRLAVVRERGGYRQRDRWIREQWVNGVRLREIAAEAAVSVERVRQICRRRRDRPWLRYVA
jgi:hypothetical protein